MIPHIPPSQKKMGVNKNISILMLFDCVRVNTGLGFH
jgi:hypothetical protein